MNGKKAFGRRAISAGAWVLFVFASLFLPKVAGTSESLVTLFITKATEVFVVLSVSLTATDGMREWKGGGKPTVPPQV